MNDVKEDVVIPSSEEVKGAELKDAKAKSDVVSTLNAPKSGEAAAVTAVLAESLKFPQNAAYDEQIGGEYVAIINDVKLTAQERAQKLIDLSEKFGNKLYNGLQAAQAAKEKKHDETIVSEKKQWEEASRSDSEFGGHLWQESQGVIERGMKAVATDRALSVLQTLNVMEHPEIRRMFYRAGKMASEDRMGGAASGRGGKTDHAAVLFRDSLKK